MTTLPNADFNADMGKDITLKAAVGAADKAEMFYVDPDKIEKYEGFNIRTTGAAYDQGIVELASKIKTFGFRDDKPLTVIAKEDEIGKTLLAVDGHRRLDAIATVNRDAPGTITRVPVVLAKASDLESLTYGFFTANTGEPLTPYETAVAVARLVSMAESRGKETAAAKAEIAAKLGFTERYINEMLFAVTVLPKPIQRQVASGKVALRNAISEFRADPANAAKTLAAAEKAAAKAGKEKVTPKAITKAKTEAAVEAKTTKASKAAATTPAAQNDIEDAPATDVDFWRGAMELALEVGSPTQGQAMLRKWLAGDADTVANVEEYLSQPAGAFADPSLRKPVFDL